MTMGNSHYLVSAIVSTCNAERFMHGCIEDLEAQSIADRMEIIVVDSASEQNEADVVGDFKKRYGNIRYVRTDERLSLYGAWNLGLEIACGRYVTSANTDDRHAPDAIERMAAVLEQRPDIALVYADVFKTTAENQTFEQCSRTQRFKWFDWDRNLLLQKGCFIGPQPLWRRSVHHIFGNFDETLVSSGDFEFWLRISQLFDFYHLPLPLGLYLENPDSIEHRNVKIKQREDLRIQAEYLTAALKHRLIRFQPLECLRSAHRRRNRGDGRHMVECLDRIGAFMEEDTARGRMVSQAEMERYLRLRKRIQAGGEPDEEIIEQVTEVISRLLLRASRWYAPFWKTVRRSQNRQESDARQSSASANL